MKKFIFLLLLSSKLVAQPLPPDYSTSFVEASKSWVDVDYVGDNIVAHKLDVYRFDEVFHTSRFERKTATRSLEK